jgi:hypothetical protein
VGDGVLPTAHAVLTTSAGTSLDGRGEARRNPHDPAVPEVGEELAASRALGDLADRLLGETAADIAELEHGASICAAEQRTAAVRGTGRRTSRNTMVTPS